MLVVVGFRVPKDILSPVLQPRRYAHLSFAMRLKDNSAVAKNHGRKPQG